MPPPLALTSAAATAHGLAGRGPGVVSSEARSAARTLLDAPVVLRRQLVAGLSDREREHVFRETLRETGSVHGLWHDDPAGFVEDVIGETLWGLQREVMQALVLPGVNRVAVPAGFGVGKTSLIGRAVAWAGATRPIGTMQVVTTATRMRQVRSQMWPHIKTAVAKAGVPGRTDTTQWIAPDQYGNDVQVAYGFSAAPTDEAAMQGIHGCYGGDVELLTDQGWKFFPDVRGDEQVMSLRPDGVAEWGPITKVTNVEIDGYLNVHEGSRLNFSVTDGHRMLWSPMHYRKPDRLLCPYCDEEVGAKGRAQHEKKHLRAGATKTSAEWKAASPAQRQWQLGSYMDLPQEFFVRRTNDWQGVAFDPVTFPGAYAHHPSRTFTPEQFARFLGWYVAEGCVRRNPEENAGRNTIDIAQKPGTKFEAIGALLDSIGIRYHRGDHHLKFRHKALAAWLEEHCGIGSHSKRIPKIIREAPRPIIRAFLDSYRDGDGTRHTHPDSARYITASRLLADDLHEVLVKMGSARKLRLMHAKGSEGRVGDKTFTRNHDVWVVTEAGRPSDSNVKKANVHRVRHKGPVYCVTTPHETLMVRRGGTPMWCGNTPGLLLIVDEAGGIAPLIGRGTNNLLTGDAKLLATGNPAMDDPGSWFEELCAEGEGDDEPSTVTIRIAATDSPAITGAPTPVCRFCEPNLDGHTIAQGVNGKSHLPDWDWLMRTLRDYGATTERDLTLAQVLDLARGDGLHPYVMAKVFARFPQGGSARVIPASWVELARSADEPSGEGYVALRDLAVPGEDRPWQVKRGAWVRLGIDVAAGGGDEFAVYRCVGDLVTEEHVSSGAQNADSMVVADKALACILQAERVARALGTAAPVRVKIDTIGVGWGIVGHLRRMGEAGRHGAQIVAVHVGEGLHPDHVDEAAPARPYRKRDEMWLATRALLQPDPTTGQGQLRLRIPTKTGVQLSQPNLGYNATGHVKVESKDSMSKRGISSPDRGEALSLSTYEPEPIRALKRRGLL